METQFKYLSLGTRFSDPELSGRTYVKLSASTAVEFKDAVVCFDKPFIVAIWPDFHVVVREKFNEKTYHDFPKTTFQEGQEFYWENPRRWENPYEEGTPEHQGWDDGYEDAYDGDCE
jgi:hypothetical protein